MGRRCGVEGALEVDGWRDTASNPLCQFYTNFQMSVGWKTGGGGGANIESWGKIEGKLGGG